MPRGGKREGAGAPKGNRNALKHGGRAKVLYGIPLNKKLSRFEYRALCAYSGDGEHRFRFYREHLNFTHWVHDIFNLSVHYGQF